MRVNLHLWRNNIKNRPWVVVVAVVGIALIVAIILGYWLDWNWAGLGPYTSSTKDSTFQRGKTLWDWLQLLIIPIMLTIGGFWLNQMQKNREEKTVEEHTKIERELAEKRVQNERNIAEDNQHEVALQIYIDKMSELLLVNKLRESDGNSEIRKIARVRTLTQGLTPPPVPAHLNKEDWLLAL